MKKVMIAIGAIAAISFSSCKKSLLDTAPYGSLATESMWSSDNLTDLGETVFTMHSV